MQFARSMLMRMRFVLKILFLTSSLPLLSQVVPSATDKGQQNFAIGAGISWLNPDYSAGSIYGGTLWADYSLRRLVPFLPGLGLELEAHDSHFDRSSGELILREDAALGGVTYSISRFRKVRPYGKFEAGLGNVDYLVSATRSYHQSRTVTGFGGGLDYLALRKLSMRLGYEYQYLPDFFLGLPAKPTSTPLEFQCVTLGAMYRFRH